MYNMISKMGGNKDTLMSYLDNDYVKYITTVTGFNHSSFVNDILL